MTTPKEKHAQLTDRRREELVNSELFERFIKASKRCVKVSFKWKRGANGPRASASLWWGRSLSVQVSETDVNRKDFSQHVQFLIACMFQDYMRSPTRMYQTVYYLTEPFVDLVTRELDARGVSLQKVAEAATLRFAERLASDDVMNLRKKVKDQWLKASLKHQIPNLRYAMGRAVEAGVTEKEVMCLWRQILKSPERTRALVRVCEVLRESPTLREHMDDETFRQIWRETIVEEVDKS